MTRPAAAVPYAPAIDAPDPRERAAIEDLKDVFADMAATVARHEGHAYRAVHAKGHALLEARFEVRGDLPAELAHGLFARPGHYRALARLSSPPAEQLPDTVSTPRAIALKVLEVPGARVETGDGATSQDFLMVNAPAFSAPDPAGFLRAARLLAATTERMPRTKEAISSTLRGASALLDRAGIDAAPLRGLGGEPMRHPLGETYFSQAPFLYGPYMAKFSLAPRSPALLALEDQALAADADAQREAVRAFFQALEGEVEWAFRVQLCRDLERMPVADPSVEWPEDVGPWQEVARLVVPAQLSWGDDSQALDDRLAFSPWNALAAHRPLGAINRARREVMEVSRRLRSTFNGCPLHEPRAGSGDAADVAD